MSKLTLAQAKETFKTISLNFEPFDSIKVQYINQLMLKGTSLGGQGLDEDIYVRCRIVQEFERSMTLELMVMEKRDTLRPFIPDYVVSSATFKHVVPDSTDVLEKNIAKVFTHKDFMAMSGQWAMKFAEEEYRPAFEDASIYANCLKDGSIVFSTLRSTRQYKLTENVAEALRRHNFNHLSDFWKRIYHAAAVCENEYVQSKFCNILAGSLAEHVVVKMWGDFINDAIVGKRIEEETTHNRTRHRIWCEDTGRELTIIDKLTSIGIKAVQDVAYGKHYYYLEISPAVARLVARDMVFMQNMMERFDKHLRPGVEPSNDVPDTNVTNDTNTNDYW